MTENNLLAVVALITALGNIGYQFYQAWKKTKPEVKKLEKEVEKIDTEKDSEIADATHTTLEASEISTKMLLNRLEELKTAIEAEKELRKQDRIYFNRRIRELDRELHDYRNWAAQLAKQVIEAGKTPAPFVLSLDTDKGIQKDEK